jgi:hypothetical protein
MKLHIRMPSRAAAPFVAAVLLFSSAWLSHAQSASQRRDERRADMEARQRELRGLSERVNKAPRKEPDTRPSYRQVAEDFEQLQLRNYNLTSAVAPGTELDYGRIGEEAAEVRRHASRLRSTLALPSVKKDEKKKRDGGALSPEGVKAAIASLDTLVRSFAWNPVFRRPDVLDAENSARAARELADILALSEQLREAAGTLAKVSRR